MRRGYRSREKNYVLYIVDLGEDHEQNGPDVFVPTFDNMRTKLKEEFAGDLKEDLIDQVMNDEYAQEFRKQWEGFNQHLKDEGLPSHACFKPNKAKNFAESELQGAAVEEFKARQKVLAEIGALEIFTGNGLTEMASQPGKPGALETLEIQHNPQSVKNLVAQNKIKVISLRKT